MTSFPPRIRPRSSCRTLRQSSSAPAGAFCRRSTATWTARRSSAGPASSRYCPGNDRNDRPPLPARAGFASVVRLSEPRSRTLAFPPSISRAMEGSGLFPIAEKVLSGKRLSVEDGVRLFESRDLLSVGAMADFVRRSRHADRAYFVRNMHLNPTNVCTVDCKFCGFYRPYAHRERGWTLSLEQCFQKVRERASGPLTEVHIVGGHNPDLPYRFYLDLLGGIKNIRPDIHLKAFTCAEYDFFSKRFKRPLEEIFEDFKRAGLGSLPGGGAEVLTDRVRQLIYPKKLTAEEWLDVARRAHRAGLRSNATLLYGHVETFEERVIHLCR